MEIAGENKAFPSLPAYSLFRSSSPVSPASCPHCLSLKAVNVQQLVNRPDTCMTQITWQLADSTESLNWDDWCTVCKDPSDLPMDPRFLRAVEQAMADVSETGYLIGYNTENEPVACTCISRFLVDGSLLTGPKHRTVINLVRKLYPGYLKFRVFFCGLPVSIGSNSLRFAEGYEQGPILESLVTEIERLAAEMKSLVVVWKEFFDEDCSPLQGLIAHGYQKADSLPMNVMHCSHPSFDEFCGAMRSHYRYKIKKSQKKFTKSGIRVEHVTDPQRIEQLYTPEAHELYLAVFEHAEIRLEILPRQFFLNLVRELPEETSFTAVFYDDQLVGFAWGLLLGQLYRNIFVGFNYDLNEGTDLYFNTMMSDLDYGMRTGAQRVFMGQSADDFKSRLGCVQHPLSIYVKLRNTTLNWLAHKGSKLIFPPYKRAPVRDLLKEPEPTTQAQKVAVSSDA